MSWMPFTPGGAGSASGGLMYCMFVNATLAPVVDNSDAASLCVSEIDCANCGSWIVLGGPAPGSENQRSTISQPPVTTGTTSGCACCTSGGHAVRQSGQPEPMTMPSL